MAERTAWWPRLPGTVAFRLALGYGLLVVGSMTVVSLMFYFGTVGVLAEGTDRKLTTVSARLSDYHQRHSEDGLQQEIQRLLDDGIESDTEVYFLATADGQKIVGNLSSWPETAPFERLTDQQVIRAGRASFSRLLPHRLSTGAILVVGRDLKDQRRIENLVWRALGGGGALAFLLAVGGALLFRRRIEARIAAIRRTAAKIETGDLSWRIPTSGQDDEFSRLNRDINHMLDRIQHLMDGVRHVSNTIAHDLRTPLGRIRAQLEEALRPGRTLEQVSGAAGTAIGGIDDLIVVFEKLLQIAEAEAGTHRQSFGPVALRAVVTDVVELYDAMAEAGGIALRSEIDGDPTILGDKDLLAGALANLIENALKYAGGGARIDVRVAAEGEMIAITVQDDGPGIPAAERSKVMERFYRLDTSRSQPGNGLGLSLVGAVASLHRGWICLDDGAPGLIARIILPRADVPSFQTVS